MRTAFLCLVCCSLALGCATGPTRTDVASEDEDYVTDVYCSPAVDPNAPATASLVGEFAVPKPLDLPEDLLPLSPASRQIADVIQVQHLVAQIPVLEQEVAQNVPGSRLKLLELRQELSDRVLLALFDASSVAAELECEKGRADALASGMEEKQNDIQQRRTVIALLADATAGLLSGIFLFGGSDVLAGGADIIGNLLQGSFGWAALGGQQQYELHLTRNHLKEVWEGPESSALFPESVWRFLNRPLSANRNGSRRDLIVQEWKTRLDAGKPDKEGRRTALFFGEGGVFTGTQLRHRAEMLDRVKSSVRLMSKDLNLLFKESLGRLYGMSQLVNGGALMLD